ncbi:MAG: hypothetical protein ACKO2P_07165, partial [Planctomycetota bacterium]
CQSPDGGSPAFLSLTNQQVNNTKSPHASVCHGNTMSAMPVPDDPDDPEPQAARARHKTAAIPDGVHKSLNLDGESAVGFHLQVCRTSGGGSATWGAGDGT